MLILRFAKVKLLLIIVLFALALLVLKTDKCSTKYANHVESDDQLLKPKNTIEKIDEENDYRLFKSFLSDIKNSSVWQKFIPTEVLLTTIKFMIDGVDEYDPELIRFVRQLIQPPNDRTSLNLKNMTRKDFSQSNQSSKVDTLLERQENGFFIEADGYNGETIS